MTCCPSTVVCCAYGVQLCKCFRDYVSFTATEGPDPVGRNGPVLTPYTHMHIHFPSPLLTNDKQEVCVW